MAYTFTPTGQAAKFWYSHYVSSESLYVIEGPSEITVPIFRSDDYSFPQYCATHDLSYYPELADVEGKSSKEIESAISAFATANGISTGNNPGISTKSENYAIGDRGLSIVCSMGYFHLYDTSSSYNYYFKTSEGDKVILCTDKNGEVGWIHISPENSEVRFVSSHGTGNFEVEDLYTITGISISSPDSVTQGSNAEFTVTVEGTGEFDSTCTATLSGNTSTETTLTETETPNTYRLECGSDETATEITVTVTSVADSSISAAKTISVENAVTITSISISSPDSVTQGEKILIISTIEGTGDFDNTCSITLSGNSDLTTELIESPIQNAYYLKCGLNETATEITVTVTSVANPTISASKTVLVEAITYHPESFQLGLAVGLGLKGWYRAAKPVAYLYNDVRLPKLPDLPYTYAAICERLVYGFRADTRLVVATVPFAYDSDDKYLRISEAFSVQTWIFDDEANAWVFDSEKTAESYNLNCNLIWTNYDCFDSDGVLSMEASTPVPVYE